MNPIPQRIFNLLIIGLGAGIIMISIGARWYITSFETARLAREAQTQNETQAQLTAVTQRVAVLQHATDALLAANQSVATQLANEQAKRVAAEQARVTESAKAQQQISQLKQDLESAKTPNLSAIVKEWRPRVAQVVCLWNIGGGTVAESSGSGVLMTGGIDTIVVTNRHVVTYNDQVADRCTVKFPDDPAASLVTAFNITVSSAATDWAKLRITKPSPIIKALADMPAARCAVKPTLGESIVILGYPSVGAQGDITATEGIISGFEGNYFISSAKVERGNSGGAAILAKENCYLGIPSYVGAGQIESLARILDQHIVFQ